MSKLRVLIIEDNVDLCANLWDFLESRGHTVDAAHDGAKGLRMATSEDYDVIVLDLSLPTMDGIEICRKLRMDAGKSTPVLILSARDTLEDKLIGF